MTKEPLNRAEGLRAAERRRARRAAALRELLEPGEVPVEVTRGVLITERRVVFAGTVEPDGSVRHETPDALVFDEIEGWARGERHDRRPLLRLDHVPHERIQHVPAHRFLRFRWGNAWAPVTRRTTVLPFNRAGDAVLVALIEQLRSDAVPEGPPFAIRPRETREERLGPSVAYLASDEPSG
jgi:hypothetical protein